MIKKSDKKGVSPVIATVLLISMVIIIGVIIFLWFRGMVGETITKFGENAELACEDVVFDASYIDGILYLSNDGNVPIYNMNLKIVGDRGHTTSDLKVMSEWGNLGDWGLNQGKTFSGDISDYEGVSDAEKIILIPVLLGSTDKGETKEFVCDEEQYGFEIIV